MMILLAALLAGAPQDPTLSPVAQCHDAQVARYAALDEPATVVVKAVRAACWEPEKAELESAVSQFRQQHPTIPQERVEAAARKALDEAYDARILQRVMDGRVSRKSP